MASILEGPVYGLYAMLVKAFGNNGLPWGYILFVLSFLKRFSAYVLNLFQKEILVSGYAHIFRYGIWQPQQVVRESGPYAFVRLSLVPPVKHVPLLELVGGMNEYLFPGQ